MLGRLRIWRTGLVRELPGVPGPRVWSGGGDLDRNKANGPWQAHADSARQIEREVREAYRRGLRDADRREPPSDVDRVAREMKEHDRAWERGRDRSITRIPPRASEPRGRERGGGGFER